MSLFEGFLDQESYFPVLEEIHLYIQEAGQDRSFEFRYIDYNWNWVWEGLQNIGILVMLWYTGMEFRLERGNNLT